jgi:molecular chaperone Hsp33
MMAYDTLQRFIFENISVRGEIVRLRSCYQTVIERHPYPPVISQMLAETLSAVALLSATIKFTGSLTLQIQGNGPVSLLLAQCNDQLHLRGLAKWEGADIPESFAKATGEGHLAITITPTQGERYQGVVTLGDNDLAGCIEKYFMQSEQLPTSLVFASDANDAVGILLQIIPNETNQENFFDWDRVKQILKLVPKQELLMYPNELILKTLFPEDDIRVFPADPVSFRCTCTVEKMQQAVRMYGYEEAQNILKTHPYVIVTCEFCHRHYDFDKVDVENLFHDNLPSQGSH